MLRWGVIVVASLIVAQARSLSAVEVPIAIGVISPSGGGRSTRAGLSHASSIRMGLEHAGRVIRAGNVSVKLRTLYKNDRGDPATSVELAKELVERDGVVAILGPVNSGCTKEVLNAGLSVPVISAL